MTMASTAVSVRPMSSGLTFTLALACGITAANMYYTQPIASLLAADYGMPVASSGLFVTATQLGYALGLVAAVPLTDAVENRRLIAAMLAILIATLSALWLAPTAALFMIAAVLVGISSTVVQIIVAYAGHLAPDHARGRVVGNVVSGLLFGVMLARPVSSFAAHFLTHRAIFGLSALASGVLALLLWTLLPDRRPRSLPYLKAIGSLWPLLRDTEILQRRGLYQVAMFGVFTIFWTVVPILLSSPRFGFDQAGIGAFALAGAAGALISPYAGRAADQGKTWLVTIFALSGAMLAFVVAAAGGVWTSWPVLLLAALILDVATAANLVAGQRGILSAPADVRGRLNGLYLAMFFAGGSLASFVSGYLYAYGGWTGVCLACIAIPLVALGYFATEKR